MLKEVFRFVPLVGGVFRQAIASKKIFPSTDIQYLIAPTHKDEEIYHNHQKFDPDRFFVERAEDRQKNFGYLPFGGSLRECLGKEFARLEMKIFASILARNYHWELLLNQDLEMVVLPTPYFSFFLGWQNELD